MVQSVSITMFTFIYFLFFVFIFKRFFFVGGAEGPFRNVIINIFVAILK